MAGILTKRLSELIELFMGSLKQTRPKQYNHFTGSIYSSWTNNILSSISIHHIDISIAILANANMSLLFFSFDYRITRKGDISL